MAKSFEQLRKEAAQRSQGNQMSRDSLLDTLNKINNSGSQIQSPQILRAEETEIEKVVPASFENGTTVFYTNHGAGSIIIGTTEYKLPLTTSDKLLIAKIKTEYSIGSFQCPIKMRVL